MVNIDKVLSVRDDSEMQMAKSDLYNLAKNSVQLYKIVKELPELEGWTQAKITKAADYIASVLRYMEYEAHEDRIGLNEMASSGGTSSGAIAASPMPMGKKKKLNKRIKEGKVGKPEMKTWEVNYDYGPHQDEYVTVRARTKQEAETKGMKLGKKGHRSIRLNYVKEIKKDVKEEKQKGVDGKACWDGYKRMGTKKKGGNTVDNCVPIKKK